MLVGIKTYTFQQESEGKETDSSSKFYLNCYKGVFMALREENIFTRADYENCIKSAEKKFQQKVK